MLMPTFLPKEFSHLSTLETDEELFEKVKSNLFLFVPFFVTAADDETWSENHPVFMRIALKWVSTQFTNDSIPFEMAKTVADAIRAHYQVLEPQIPVDLTCRSGEHTFEINSLLFGTSSDFLHDFFLKECVGKEHPQIQFKGLDWNVFKTLAEWMCTGRLETLWKREEVYLWKVLRQSSVWGLQAVSELAQEILRRYLNRTNVFEHLILSNEQEWHALKQACCDLINDLNLSIKISDRSPIGLCLEFFEFNRHALGVFERIQKSITHLVFSQTLTEEAPFSEILAKCPRLRGLDISRTRIFSERLSDIPAHLEELDLSMCGWLTSAYLNKLFKICPQLVKLNLSSNSQLPPGGWSELIHLPALNFLEISRCHQIGDDELKLIVKAAPLLVDFRLEECTKITDRGFLHLPLLTKLTTLSLARCEVGDVPLIEIGTKCLFLQTLDLTRCENVTDRGLLETVRQAKSLRAINLTHCAISQGAQQELKRIRPGLIFL
ncbi:MAG: hypothetical protein CK425_03085 [Parachlamydia sp.]|nr:MAG: hypothetical protein CK425_03085 [Parachlamydia sp.]